jgi:hypothetical protein
MLNTNNVKTLEEGARIPSRLLEKQFHGELTKVMNMMLKEVLGNISRTLKDSFLTDKNFRIQSRLDNAGDLIVSVLVDKTNEEITNETNTQ